MDYYEKYLKYKQKYLQLKEDNADLNVLVLCSDENGTFKRFKEYFESYVSQIHKHIQPLKYNYIFIQPDLHDKSSLTLPTFDFSFGEDEKRTVEFVSKYKNYFNIILFAECVNISFFELYKYGFTKDIEYVKNSTFQQHLTTNFLNMKNFNYLSLLLKSNGFVMNITNSTFVRKNIFPQFSMEGEDYYENILSEKEKIYEERKSIQDFEKIENLFSRIFGTFNGNKYVAYLFKK
jgi:hypothetical protein